MFRRRQLCPEFLSTLPDIVVIRAKWRVTSVLRSKTLAQAEFTSAEHDK